VDKLDKLPWEQVKQEMVEVKGLSEEVAERIHQYVQLKGTAPNMQTNSGGRDLIEKLQADSLLVANKSASHGLQDMSLLFNYLDILDSNKNVPHLHLPSNPALFRLIPRPRSGLLHRPNLRSNHLGLSPSPSSHNGPHLEKETCQPRRGYL
jgi:hypothetical protein